MVECYIMSHSNSNWKILIVDDDPKVHQLTKVILKEFNFEGRKLDFYSAHSEAEALEVLKNHSDIAVILLDLVMENPDSGLRIVRALRQELFNKIPRIVMRTAHSSDILANEIISKYDINDYRSKTELTSQKLINLVYISLRSYKDLLELDHSRQLLIKSERMTFMSGLASGMAHEIRNPLTAILGNAEVLKNILIKEHADNSNNSDKLKIIENIKKAVNIIVEIIDNMLDFSRISQFNLEKQNIILIIEDAIQLLSSDLELKRKYKFNPAMIHLEYPDNLPKISCSKIEIMQVFINIIKNAIHALVETKRPEISIKLNITNNFLNIQIKDNGMGISPEILPNIFKPFFSTKKSSGTGLGLAICLYIVEDLHRGLIEVSSNLNQGTEFIIKLPIL